LNSPNLKVSVPWKGEENNPRIVMALDDTEKVPDTALLLKAAEISAL